MSLSLIANSYKTEDDSGDDYDNDENQTLLELKLDSKSESELSENNADIHANSSSYPRESYEDGGGNDADDILTKSLITTPPPTVSRQEAGLEDGNRSPDEISDDTNPKTEDNFECPHCLISFAGNWILIRHLRISHTGLDSKPSDEYENGNNVRPTQIRESKGKPHRARASSNVKIKKKNISRRNNATLRKRFVPKTKERTARKCEKCNLTFQHLHNLTRHMKIHTEKNRPFRCTQCQSFFLNLTSLRTHENVVHDRPGGLSMISCVICGRDLPPSKLEIHMRIHTHEKPFACSSSPCGKRFSQLHHLRSHLRTVHGKDVATSTLRSLQAPTKLDTSGRNMKFLDKKETGRVFSLLPPSGVEVLHDDKETITQLRKGQAFQCPYCLDKFLHCEKFIKHLQIHKKGNHKEATRKQNNGPAKIKRGKGHRSDGAIIMNARRRHKKCQTCNASFRCQTYLQRHMKVHEETHGSWKCSQCSSYFKRVTTLRIHENKMHNRKTGATPCPCPHCGKIFWAPSRLTVHMNGVHRNEISKLDLTSHTEHVPHGMIDHHKTLDADLANQFNLRPCKVILKRCDAGAHLVKKGFIRNPRKKIDQRQKEKRDD